jgi:hypothetical protein
MAHGHQMATAVGFGRYLARVDASETRIESSEKVRARSSIWIEQGTPKPKVASSILAGRTSARSRGEQGHPAVLANPETLC